MTQRVAIVQDLTDLSVKLVGPGAMPRIAEINESADLHCYSAYFHDIGYMCQAEALKTAWRQLKLETQPV